MGILLEKKSLITDLNLITLTSLKLRASAVKVVFTTAGLFLTLGKITPPFRDTLFAILGFVDVKIFVVFCVVVVVVVDEANSVLLFVKGKDEDEVGG